VSQAASAKLSREGAAALAALSSDHLSSALALYERFDADGDGRLQPDEFARLLGLISRQNGVRFSTKEVDCLFETADLANAGSLDVLEVLLLLEQLGLQLEAPAELEAYRARVLHEAARSMVKLESAAAEHRRQTAKAPDANALHSERAGAGRRGSVLRAPDETIEECVLLMRRYDRGRKGYLEFDEFCALVNNVAVEAGGRPPTHMESHLLWERADTDNSGTIDLNELYLHLMAASPIAKTADPWLLASLLATGGSAEGAALGDGSAPAKVPSELPLCSPAVAQAEAIRHRRVAALLTSAAPFLDKVAGTAAPFGRAELRALAHLFDDLDTDGDGALTLHEFVALLALLAERAASTALEPSASTAQGPKSAAVRRTASSTIGMREAHAIYQQRGLEPSQTLSFVGFLELLAVDERMPTIGKPTAQSSSRARRGSNRKQRADARGGSTEKHQLQQQVQPQRDRRRRREKRDLAAPQVQARGRGGLV
jgi:Ca2+-binding EF-hand superfamily protein